MVYGRPIAHRPSQALFTALSLASQAGYSQFQGPRRAY